MPGDYIDVLGSDPNEKPEYPRKRFKNKKQHEIVEGEKFDVTRLLSSGKRDFLIRNNGDKVDIAGLKNKYVVICCFFIPFTYFEEEADVCRLLISAYSEWLSRTENQFEMVVVAKMKKDWVNNEAVFNHFFSAFPCLSIPFYDLKSRDHVCWSLGLTGDTIDLTMSGLILDRDHKVLRKGGFTEYLLDYGAVFFPFTASRVDEIEGEDADLIGRLDSFSDDETSSGEESSSSGGKESSSSGEESSSSSDEEAYSMKSVSLAELFKCNPNYKLQRLRCDEGHEEDPDNVITVSELSKKNCVGVYLCGSGSVMEGLAGAYEACKDRDLEFEVVIACLPSNGDPTTFLEDLKHLANDCGGISSSWWLLPYNEEVNLRLARIRSGVEADKLIIARPDGKAWEMRGKSILFGFGSRAYPFTKESILEKKKSLSLEQLLGGASQQLRRCGVQAAENVADLVKKNTLVFFGCHYDDIINVKGSNDEGRNLELLLRNYPAIKRAGCEVVFVPLDFQLDDSITCNCAKMDWLKLPLSAAAMAVREAYFPSHGWPSAIYAFGEGGHLRSTRADKYLQDLGSLFADDKVVLEAAKYQRRSVVACLKRAEDAWGMH